jgi:uncharacterized protein (TIGR00369 family)
MTTLQHGWEDSLKENGWRVLEADGFIAHVGPFWVKTEGGAVQMGFVADERHKNRRGIVQGGMIATLADRAMGLAIRLNNAGAPQTTIQLDIHYVDGAKIGDFIEAHCRVVRRTRHVLFVDADLVVGDRLVATAKGIWKALAVRDQLGHRVSMSD